MSEARNGHPANIWTPPPTQAASPSVTKTSAYNWSSSPRATSLARPAGENEPLSVTEDAFLRGGLAEDQPRGRSKSTSATVVADLLLKVQTGRRGGTRTASQPPHTPSVMAPNDPTPVRGSAPQSIRPRMASASSEILARPEGFNASPSQSSFRGPLGDGPLSASFPSQAAWGPASPAQRSPLLDRHLNLLGNPPIPSTSATNGSNFHRIAGTSLPANDWTSHAPQPRGRSPAGPSPPGFGRGRDLSPISGAAGGGIGYSNMSPFTRDGSLLPYGSPGAHHALSFSGRPREHSLGAVGSGRGRDTYANNGAMSYGAVEEDEEDEIVAQPTKSGATSRRHSLAVLPSRPAHVSHGFQLPSSGPSQPSPRQPPPHSATGIFGPRSMGFSDDELVADLNSLQLNLEAAVAKSPQMVAPSPYGSSPQQPAPFPSMPSHHQAMPAPLAQPPPPHQQHRMVSHFPPGPPQLMQMAPASMAATADAYFSAVQTSPTALMQQPFFPTGTGPSYPFAPSNQLPPPSSAPQVDLQGPPVYFGAQSHPQPEIVELGRGVPLHHLPPNSLIYFVEFKAGRTDLFYVADPNVTYGKGDIVIVEADRGKDLGRVVHDGIGHTEVRAFQRHSINVAMTGQSGDQGRKSNLGGEQDSTPPQHAQTLARMMKEIHPKQIYGLASPADISLLTTKLADEAKALIIVRAKVETRQLPMALTDAEWQIDRRKLTIFYVSSRRIDFRELVRELFKVFKTRIWFSPVERQVEGPTPAGRF